MDKLLVLALLALGSVAGPAQASTFRCNGLTQLEMNVCAAEELLAREASLERIARSLRAMLEGEERAGFDRSQLAWSAFRAAECERRAYASRSGSIHAMERALCLAELARERGVVLARPTR